MEELHDNQLPEEVQPEVQIINPDRVVRAGCITKGIRLLALILLFYAGYYVVSILVPPVRSVQQIYLVPEDAVFILRSNRPVEDWKELNGSPTWQCLRKAVFFKEIAAHANTLDSVVQANNSLLSLVGERDMLISIHKTRPADWDFLLLLDMQKMSKIELLKEQLDFILELVGSTVTRRKYNGVDILEVHNTETRDVLYLAFVENHLVASYTSKLVAAAIDEAAKSKTELNPAFVEVEKMVAGKGLCRFYVNYANLPRFMDIYLKEKDEYLEAFVRSMEYAGLYFNTNKEKVEIKGYILPKDTADPYVTALLASGRHKMKAHEIIPERTALYTNIGFDDPRTFVGELEKALLQKDKDLYAAYTSSRKKIEGLGISPEEHFLSWMSGEFALSQSEAGLLGHESELILAIRAKDIRKARENMEFIAKRIGKKTPVRIKTVKYKDYEVNYMEMKGFFRLFFGGMFDKFEKPYFTYVEDYVVLSNKPASLLSFIEDYDHKRVLKNEPGFKRTYASFDSSSTLFVYADVPKFYPQLQTMLTPTVRAELQADKETLYSFPRWGMQVTGDKHAASLHYVMDYEPYREEAVAVVDSDDSDAEMNEAAESEKELMSELKRFYVEKFEGNVLREFYHEGALKSETEVKDGKRHGRYREYYEDGTLKVRGKYSKNQPKGTWKYYTEEGKFERKEKF